MPFLAMIAAAVMGAAVWWWRLKMLREAGSKAIDTFETMRGAYKRRDFRKKAEAAPLASIANPAIAAVCFFWALACQRPVEREGETRLIRERMTGIIPAEEMDDVLIFADWATRTVVAPENLVSRFQKLWHATLTLDERRHLISIAEEVCAVQGEETAEQQIALKAARRALLN